MKPLTPQQLEEARKIFRSELSSSGGKARAEKLTPRRRKQIAKKAAQARWGKKNDKENAD